MAKNLMLMSALLGVAALGLSEPRATYSRGRSEGFQINEKGKQMQRFKVKKPRNRKGKRA